jgi:hypothetical protein
MARIGFGSISARSAANASVVGNPSLTGLWKAVIGELSKGVLLVTIVSDMPTSVLVVLRKLRNVLP